MIQDDIDKATLGCKNCPLSRMFKRSMPTLEEKIAVINSYRPFCSGYDLRIINDIWNIQTIPLPKEACELARNFDVHGKHYISPITFEMELRI